MPNFIKSLGHIQKNTSCINSSGSIKAGWYMSHYSENQIVEFKVGCAPQEIDTENWWLSFQIFLHILVIMTLVSNYLLFVYHHFYDFSELSRNVSWLIKFVNRIFSGFTISESHIFNILLDVSSYPCALHGSRVLITLMIPLF